MAITENDIIANAQLIATIVNGSTGKTINQLTEDASPADGDFLPSWDTSAAATKKVAKSNLGGGASLLPFWLPAGSLDYPQTAPVPLDDISLTNEEILGHPFDDATNEYGRKVWTPPQNLDTSGNITIYYFTLVDVATPSGNVIWQFQHAAASAGADSVDQAFTSVDFDAQAYTTQKQVEVTSKTVSIATLGWAVDDIIRIKIGRNATSGSDTLADDAYLLGALIMVPVA